MKNDEQNTLKNSPSSVIAEKGVTTIISWILFSLAVLVLLVNALLVYTKITLAFSMPLRAIAGACLLATVVLNYKKIHADILCLALLGLSLFACLLHGLNVLNLPLLLILALSSRAFDKTGVVKLFAVVALIAFALYLVLLSVGCIDVLAWTWEGRTRNNLGFYHVNAASLFFASLIIIPYAFFPKSKVALLGFSAILVGICIVTDTRSIIVFSLLLVISSLFFTANLAHDRVKLCQRIALAALIVAIVFAFIMPLTGDYKLNAILSYRLTITEDALSDLGLVDWLFGTALSGQIDNSYFTFLSFYGLPSLVLIILLIGRSMKRAACAKDGFALAFLVSMSLLGTVESILVRPEYLITMLFWCLVLRDDSAYCVKSASAERE